VELGGDAAAREESLRQLGRRPRRYVQFRCEHD
jgi:hypothetical protein